jgi:hypothetical protein
LPVTTPPSLNSLLVRLQHANDPIELADTLKELIDYPDALDQVAQIVERKIDAGTYVLGELLASLVLRTRSSRLYQKVRERLLRDDWTALTLYKGQYPDPEIEKTLCSTLYAVRSNDAEPRRRHIVDAMREVGSEATLPTLEAVLFDLKPSVQVREAFPDAFGLVDSMAAKSRISFVKLVALAIEDIRSRAASVPEAVSSGTPEHEPDERIDETDNARRNGTMAQRFLDAEPEIAVMLIRRGAEALSKDLYRRLGHEKNGKPARKMTLEELLKPVKDSDAPEVFKILVQTFQLFGNFAAHDQDDQSKYFTKEMAAALYALYDQALSLYSAWSDNSKSQ